MAFTKEYFNSLYSKDETIDGDFNAKDHALYLKSLFGLMGYHPSSIFDFGFGKGNLLKEVSKSLECVRVSGCDVSSFAYSKLKNKSWAKDWRLIHSGVSSLKIPRKPYDLGLCNSVLQYLNEKEMKKAIQVMAKSCKYVYLHVPSEEDYRILKADLEFDDPYALKRKNKIYLNQLSKYFTFVSWGLLESKKYNSHKKSIFMDSLYRF